MENASKALLIAGAILIAIVLITFGVMILGQGSEIIKSSSMSETEISTFNAKFTSFEGKKVRGSKVNSLLNTVVQNNLSQDDDGKKVEVGSTENGKEWLAKTDTGVANGKKADTGITYSVTCSYSDAGLINHITITPGPTTTTTTTE